MSSPNERPRIAELRLALAERLSRLSTDPALLEDLQKQPLERLMVLHVHRAILSVATRPRKVIIKNSSNAHWQKIAPNALELLRLVEAGGNVIPYICLSPHFRDFPIPGGGYAEWHDKDMLLAAMGYHVFQCEPRGRDRTGNHVLAFVDRTTFSVIGAFHGNAVIGDGPERQRLWELIRAHGIAPMSRQALVNVGIDRVKKIEEIDPKLDDPEFIDRLYAETGSAKPPTVNWKWNVPYMDFGFLETNAPRFFMIWPGPN